MRTFIIYISVFCFTISLGSDEDSNNNNNDENSVLKNLEHIQLLDISEERWDRLSNDLVRQINQKIQKSGATIQMDYESLRSLIDIENTDYTEEEVSYFVSSLFHNGFDAGEDDDTSLENVYPYHEDEEKEDEENNDKKETIQNSNNNDIVEVEESKESTNKVEISEEEDVDEQNHNHGGSGGISAEEYVNGFFDTAYYDTSLVIHNMADVTQLVLNYVINQKDAAKYEAELQKTLKPIKSVIKDVMALDVSADTDQKRHLFTLAVQPILDEPNAYRKLHLCMDILVTITTDVGSSGRSKSAMAKTRDENVEDFTLFIKYLASDVVKEINENQLLNANNNKSNKNSKEKIDLTTDQINSIIQQVAGGIGGNTNIDVKIISGGNGDDPTDNSEDLGGFEHLVVNTPNSGSDNTDQKTITVNGNNVTNVKISGNRSVNGSSATNSTVKVWGPLSVYPQNYTHVVELNKYNFDRAIAENDFVFVLFYAPWCHRSQTLGKEFEETRRIYQFGNESRVLFAKVNCHENMEIRDKQSIGGYPVIQLYRRHGGNVIPRGPTHPDSLASIIRRSTLNPIHHIESIEEYDKFLNIAGHSFIGVFPNNQSMEYHKFAFIAKKLSYKIPIGFVNDTALAKSIFERHKFLSPIYGIILAIPQENIYYLNRCDIHDAPGVFKWLTLTQPSVNELASDNLAKLSYSKKPVVVLFINYTLESTYPLVEDRPLSKNLLNFYSISHDYKTLFNLFYTDGVSYRDFYEKLGITQLPSVAIIDIDNETHYILPSDKEITTENLKSFLNDFQENKLSPYIYSDTIVDSRKIPKFVSKSVRDSFDSQVLNSKKHSLVYFYEPWCGFCKTMNIYYESAAEEILKQFGSSVQVLDYDSSVNSLPKLMQPIIDGYPHISLFLSDDTQHPVTYNGTRSVESIIYFVKSHLEKEIKKDEKLDTNVIDYQKLSLEMAEKEF